MYIAYIVYIVSIYIYICIVYIYICIVYIYIYMYSIYIYYIYILYIYYIYISKNIVRMCLKFTKVRSRHIVIIDGVVQRLAKVHSIVVG